MTQTRFILASSSPRRQELLTKLGVKFEVIKPEVDETHHLGEPPHDYVKRLSQIKAQTVVNQLQEGATILAADTIVILAADTIGVEANGEILGKPQNVADAQAMLQRLRNTMHQVCTAFTLQQSGDKPRTVTEMICTAVHMRNYTDAEMEAYIATGDPFDKAGGYAIQHEGFHPVERVEGSRTNVIGLPIEAVETWLREWGIL